MCLLYGPFKGVGKVFDEFPEGLQSCDKQWTIDFNTKLMRKEVMKKKKDGQKFVDSKIMQTYFLSPSPSHNHSMEQS